MRIPLIFKRNNNNYIFVKKCNDNLFQYSVYRFNRFLYTETFDLFDLGLREEMIKPPQNDLNVEKVKI